MSHKHRPTCTAVVTQTPPLLACCLEAGGEPGVRLLNLPPTRIIKLLRSSRPCCAINPGAYPPCRAFPAVRVMLSVPCRAVRAVPSVPAVPCRAMSYMHSVPCRPCRPFCACRPSVPSMLSVPCRPCRAVRAVPCRIPSVPYTVSAVRSVPSVPCRLCLFGETRNQQISNTII